jgi:hypothetical protein
MEILEENIKIENKKLAHANYIYLANEDKTFPKNDYGLVITEVRSNNKKYNIVFQCYGKLSLESVKSEIEDGHFDLYQLKEYFLNGMSRYLKFNTEAYFRIINEENPEEIKMIFTDYLECLEYLESVEK